MDLVRDGPMGGLGWRWSPQMKGWPSHGHPILISIKTISMIYWCPPLKSLPPTKKILAACATEHCCPQLGLYIIARIVIARTLATAEYATMYFITSVSMDTRKRHCFLEIGMRLLFFNNPTVSIKVKVSANLGKIDSLRSQLSFRL